MRLNDYVRVVQRRWWVVLLVVAIAAGSTYLLSSRQPVRYRSTQLVLVQPSRADFGLTEAGRMLLNPMVVYLNSTLIAQRVIDELGLIITPAALLSDVTIGSDTLRLVVQIDVESGDAQIGEAVAEAWGNVLIDYRERLNQSGAREDRVFASLPDRPTSAQIAPQPVLLTAAATVLGLLIGLLIAFALEFIDSATIRRRQDFREGDLPVLAAIPEK